MNVEHHTKTALKEVDMEGATACQVRQLVGENVNAPNFAMRQFEIAPGGHTPKHFHPYEHEVYILDGAGEVLDGESPRSITAGDVVYVAPDDVHQFRNTGDEPLRFLCLIPNSAVGKQVTVVPECSVES